MIWHIVLFGNYALILTARGEIYIGPEKYKCLLRGLTCLLVLFSSSTVSYTAAYKYVVLQLLRSLSQRYPVDNQKWTD